MLSKIWAYIPKFLKIFLRKILPLRLKQFVSSWIVSNSNHPSVILDNRGTKFSLINQGHFLSVLTEGCYEEETIEILVNLLKTGDTFIDIGANFGYYSLTGAKLVGPRGHVKAIDCNSETISILQQNIILNNASKIIEIEIGVVGAYEFPFEIISNGPGDGLCHVKPISLKKLNRKTDNSMIEAIPTLSLDDLCSNSKPSIVKIDVEGSELNVLKSGKKVFNCQAPPIIIIEFFEDALNRLNASCVELFDYLISRGYKIYRVKQGKLYHIKSPIDDNVICVPNGPFGDRAKKLISSIADN